jgi:peptidoglycan pentaglycine glycine transferase (the second and third glycine)
MKDNGFNHTNTLRYLEKLGFHKVKYSEQMEWLFALDIENKSIEEIRKGFKANTRNILNKVLKSNIKVRELDYEELNLFKKLTEETSKRKDFQDRSLSYYQNMYQTFKPLNQIKVLIAEIHFPEYIKNLEQEKITISSKLETLSNAKANDGKRKELQVSLNSITKKLEDAIKIQKEVGDNLILSGAMFMLFGDEVIYLFSGNYKKYMNFNAQYLIQWEMINYAVKNHYKRYNFYGITGNFDKNNKDYGMYEFKKGFNGYVIQLIGELQLPITYHYKLHHLLSFIRKTK